MSLVVSRCRYRIEAESMPASWSPMAGPVTLHGYLTTHDLVSSPVNKNR